MGPQHASEAVRFGEYAETWLAWRSISGRTREHYCRLLERHLLPTFASTDLRDISPTAVNAWYAEVATTTPSVRAQAYSLLRSIMEAAVTDQLIEANPCQISGVSTSRRIDSVRPVTRSEVEAISAAMPPAYRALVLMAAVLGMPVSELSELRRKDVDLINGVVQVRRAVALVNRVFRVTSPTSTEGIRDLALPPSLVPMIEAHLRQHVQPGRDSLLFPSVRDPDRHLSPSVVQQMFVRACAAAGRPDPRMTDLRRSGVKLTAVDKPV
ncbi:tyrosine-type recombinase/integrase [Mycobacterium paragordonae]|uniref:Site-specific integrase n=1 Tax=Mycobacterium paragordonae TaxID=1389713 RepID=A0ABQ1C4A0_9MYCO|nr:site-specific integrase [Mycobacterium paragordonae]GFG79132.1 hypothetical protein MPRG_24080 [Mycobacterium paragordonae]